MRKDFDGYLMDPKYPHIPQYRISLHANPDIAVCFRNKLEKDKYHVAERRFARKAFHDYWKAVSKEDRAKYKEALDKKLLEFAKNVGYAPVKDYSLMWVKKETNDNCAA